MSTLTTLAYPPRPNRALLRYGCSRCDELYEREWDAEECCQPEVYAGYICSVCEKWHEKQEEAVACCPPDNPDALDVPTAAELEAAGQVPLPMGV